ncbi:MAG: Yip1 family protein [Thermodesulfobacteriota bacterium]
MTLVERVKRILLQPKQEWEVIAGESTTTPDLYRNYIIPLAAIGPVASIIGMSIVGIGMPFGSAFRIPIVTAILSAGVHYVLSLVGVYVLALIIDFLAPTFSGEKNPGQALKLSAYSSTAAWIAAIFVIIPALGILGITGLYSLYLLYEGIPVLMKAPREKALVYTIAVAVAAIVIFVVIGSIARLLIPYPVGMPG